MITKIKNSNFFIENNSVIKDCIFNIYLLDSGYLYSAYLPQKKKHIYFESIDADNYNSINTDIIHVINTNISKKNKIFVKTGSISLIPDKIFNTKDLGVYAEKLLNAGNQNIWYTKVNSLDAYLIYTIPTPLLKTIKNYFSNIEIVPIDKLILESTSNYTQKKDSKLLFNIEDNVAIITHIKDKRIKFYNHITYKNPEEFINTILNIVKTLNIDIRKTEVIISGKIDVKSEYIKETCNYFTKISLARLPGTLNFDISMKDIPQHYFYNLFTAPLVCG
ncbi:MAG: DUF3822 family protein [Solitalea-like symbiont of Acarus siro]